MEEQMEHIDFQMGNTQEQMEQAGNTEERMEQAGNTEERMEQADHILTDVLPGMKCLHSVSYQQLQLFRKNQYSPFEYYPFEFGVLFQLF
jgi:ornithine carbamoyltransferase